MQRACRAEMALKLACLPLADDGAQVAAALACLPPMRDGHAHVAERPSAPGAPAETGSTFSATLSARTLKRTRGPVSVALTRTVE